MRLMPTTILPNGHHSVTACATGGVIYIDHCKQAFQLVRCNLKVCEGNSPKRSLYSLEKRPNC